jgi:hypothetical protein
MATVDPHVVIEQQRTGYVRYRRADGKRWEVHGVCPQRGTCMDGAVPGDVGWLPSDERPDVPIAPGIECDPCSRLLTFVEL